MKFRIFAGFANAGKNNFIAGNAEMAEMFQFAAGDDVEATAEFCQQPEDGEISVGFDSKTDCMRKRCKAFIEFEKGGLDGGAAVQISRSCVGLCCGGERDVFAKNFFAGVLL